ncbi:hypothetical protein BP5796_10803 [Coleophoma crateriformis]|uniref:CFEM domain-containing protein n=1 Tax=Coleophoma crateriformis TaxID=565419 RepID=A0A3D8QLB2_9HELO|nr:hypothetical protein BP5796_10803 [Coleophoma crateriformis]
MRLISSVFLLGVAFIGFCQGASLAELASQLPACGLSCMETAISQSSCTLANTTCICTDTTLLASATACVATSCTVKEELKVVKIQQDGCGVPVESQQTKVKIVANLFCALAEICVILRIWTKLQLTDRLSPDDWMIVVSGILIIPYWYFGDALVGLGLGLNMYDANIDTLTKYFLYFWIDELLYLNLLAVTKVSLLFFLVKIFPSRTFRVTCWSVGALCVGIAISFSAATVFSCHPISHVWDEWQGSAVSGTCNNINLQTYIAGAINIVQDFTILLLPLPELYRLQVSMRKKVQLFFMFSVGLLYDIPPPLLHLDYVEVVIWSIIESTLGIVCACMPSLRQLLGQCGSGGLFGSTDKGLSTAGNSRIYQSRSYKIENKLRSQNDEFHELASITNGNSGNASSFHTIHKASSPSISESSQQQATLDGREDEQKGAAHVWVKHQSIHD